jgi:RNA polymerase sigma-70 factor (ECF subfamily)
VPDLPAELAPFLEAARAGDRDALGDLLERCRPFLLAVANRQLNPAYKTKGGASDLVQQTFLEAQRDFDRFTGGSEDELRAWLRQLLLHNVADFARGLETDKRRADREVRLPGTSSTAGAALPGDDPTASAIAVAGEDEAKVRAALNTLPEDYRNVIDWRYKEELSFAEIASRMGRSENAVRKLWFRAIEKLEAALGGSVDGT